MDFSDASGSISCVSFDPTTEKILSKFILTLEKSA